MPRAKNTATSAEMAGSERTGDIIEVHLTPVIPKFAQQMVVASDLLTINYQSFRKSGLERIHFPYGWTARRQ